MVLGVVFIRSSHFDRRPLAASSRAGFCHIGNVCGNMRELTLAGIWAMFRWGWPNRGATFGFSQQEPCKTEKKIEVAQLSGGVARLSV